MIQYGGQPFAFILAVVEFKLNHCLLTWSHYYVDWVAGRNFKQFLPLEKIGLTERLLLLVIFSSALLLAHHFRFALCKPHDIILVLHLREFQTNMLYSHLCKLLSQRYIKLKMDKSNRFLPIIKKKAFRVKTG